MKIFQLIRNKFLKVFGDIKVFKYPFFILYDPGSYQVKGEDVRTVINTIQPGDIMVRGYKNYLDGYFIPGYFSHVGLFLGKTEIPSNPEGVNLNHFVSGEQTVIHSMAEGVFMEDVLNFCRCDFLLILRRNKETEPGLDLEIDNKTVLEEAIKNLGKPYDFEFDFSNSHNLSCTEFVYQSCRNYIKNYGVKVKKKKVLFIKKDMIIPDDFVTEKFDIVFQSKSVKAKKITKILKKNAI